MKVTDSSTIVKFFSQEPGWENLREYLYEPITIELALKELGNALWKKVNRGEFEEVNALEVLTEFQRIGKFLEQGKYLGKAFEIAVKYKITIYDSLFIAAAFLEGYDLVTSDMRQATVSKDLGINTTVC
ncbi:MAG: type II toxin-antitoxin system VapC family toxin [Thermoplasmataceae archaeon]